MFEKYKHVHFVGIGGIGMSALAKWFLHEGVQVSGSDLVMTNLTKDLEQRRAQIFSGQSAENISDTVDLVIYSPAVPETNTERQRALELGIEQKTNFEMLGEISKDFSTIVVTGTNGKSTTTAMLGLILQEAGYDPTVLVGSLVPGFKDGNFRHGKSRFFVVEGCEYRANMTLLEPEMIVLTNIEEDHLDYYRDLNHIKETFQSFVDKLQGKGLIMLNGDDQVSVSLKTNRSVRYASKDSSATYHVLTRTVEGGKQMVKTNHGDLVLQVPGSFNVMNALAAMGAAMEIGVPFETCARALSTFTGIWRRFERLGTWQGADVISDYAHHPTAIRETITAAKEFFPERRLVLYFQPHHHNRTKELFEGFVETLSGADVLIVNEIYDVAGRNEDHDVSSRELVEKIQQLNPNKTALYVAGFDEAKIEIESVIKEQDVLLIMGAGDIDTFARKLA